MAQPHKTPYEIRQNLLELAFSILHAQHSAKACQHAEESHESTALITSAPTTEEVIAEAKKLNDFVSASSRMDR